MPIQRVSKKSWVWVQAVPRWKSRKPLSQVMSSGLSTAFRTGLVLLCQGAMGSLSWVQWEQTGTGLCSSETSALETTTPKGDCEHGHVATIHSPIALVVMGCILEIAFLSYCSTFWLHWSGSAETGSTRIVARGRNTSSYRAHNWMYEISRSGLLISFHSVNSSYTNPKSYCIFLQLLIKLLGVLIHILKPIPCCYCLLLFFLYFLGNLNYPDQYRKTRPGSSAPLGTNSFKTQAIRSVGKSLGEEEPLIQG